MISPKIRFYSKLDSSQITRCLVFPLQQPLLSKTNVREEKVPIQSIQHKVPIQSIQHKVPIQSIQHKVPIQSIQHTLVVSCNVQSIQHTLVVSCTVPQVRIWYHCNGSIIVIQQTTFRRSEPQYRVWFRTKSAALHQIESDWVNFDSGDSRLLIITW